MKQNWAVYLALVLLVVMVLYSKKEGFDGHDWLSFSNYFTYSEDSPIKKTDTTTITTSTATTSTGTGLNDKQYETDTSNDLTSSEKTTAKIALTKLIALNEGNEVLISCINKVKVKL
jgi:hypothetical protein